MKFTIKFHEILEDEIEKIFLVLFFFFLLQNVKILRESMGVS